MAIAEIREHCLISAMSRTEITSANTIWEQECSLPNPGVDASKEAVNLTKNLSDLWDEATLSGRRKVLLTMLDH